MARVPMLHAYLKENWLQAKYSGGIFRPVWKEHERRAIIIIIIDNISLDIQCVTLDVIKNLNKFQKLSPTFFF